MAFGSFYFGQAHFADGYPVATLPQVSSATTITRRTSGLLVPTRHRDVRQRPRDNIVTINNPVSTFDSNTVTVSPQEIGDLLVLSTVSSDSSTAAVVNVSGGGVSNWGHIVTQATTTGR